MLYHGFYIQMTPLKNIQREKKDGSIVLCDGFQIEIFSGNSMEILMDKFTAAVGFEVINNSVQEVEQFAKDVIDSEEKGWLRGMMNLK